MTVTATLTRKATDSEVFIAKTSQLTQTVFVARVPAPSDSNLFPRPQGRKAVAPRSVLQPPMSYKLSTTSSGVAAQLRIVTVFPPEQTGSIAMDFWLPSTIQAHDPASPADLPDPDVRISLVRSSVQDPLAAEAIVTLRTAP